MVWASQSQSRAFSWRSCSFSGISSACVGPPACSASTAAWTFWAWSETVCRLQSAASAWWVTSPYVPVKHAAALAIQTARGILSMGWALRSGDHVSNPTLEAHPHDPSRPFSLAFRSVNFKVADLAQFGTFPTIERVLGRIRIGDASFGSRRDVGDG